MKKLNEALARINRLETGKSLPPLTDKEISQSIASADGVKSAEVGSRERAAILDKSATEAHEDQAESKVPPAKKFTEDKSAAAGNNMAA